jgi:hypothetical protein
MVNVSLYTILFFRKANLSWLMIVLVVIIIIVIIIINYEAYNNQLKAKAAS